MPRNRYTRIIHKSEYDQIEPLVNRLPALAPGLDKKRTADSAPALEPFVDEAKERRRARLGQKRRHKPKRPSAANTDQS